ncbi:MAG: DMT family transporter [Janthinobacterium lividum]
MQEKNVSSHLLPQKSYAFLGIIIGSLFVGMSPIFVRYSTVDPLAIGFFRFFFAVPFLWIWSISDTLKEKDSTQHRIPRCAKDYLLLALAGMFFAIDIGIWHLSLLETTVMNSTLLNNMTPIFVTLISWLILREKLTWQSVTGIVLAVLGTYLLITSDGSWGELHVYGDLMALSSAVFFAGYVLIVKHLRHHLPAPTIMAWTSMSCMYFLAIMTFSRETNIIPTTFTDWLPLIGLALIVHVLGQTFIAISLKHLSATFSSLTMMIIPVVSAIFAWILFDETFTLLKIIGGVIILAGIIIARQNEK